MKMFPIMVSYKVKEQVEELRANFVASMVIGLPWPMMATHERQAKINHDQTIQRLAERGGLSACEACAVLEDREYHRMTVAESHTRLKDLFQMWVMANITNAA